MVISGIPGIPGIMSVWMYPAITMKFIREQPENMEIDGYRCLTFERNNRIIISKGAVAHKMWLLSLRIGYLPILEPGKFIG